MNKAKKNLEISDDEFGREHLAASKAGEEWLRHAVKATTARYERKTRRLVLELQNGLTLLVPVELVQGLQDATDSALSKFELMIEGSEIYWESLDTQFYVGDLLRGVFGTPGWMSNLKEHLAVIGRKGGRSTSTAKRAASAENGKKGGRPRTKRTA